MSLRLVDVTGGGQSSCSDCRSRHDDCRHRHTVVVTHVGASRSCSAPAHAKRGGGGSGSEGGELAAIPAPRMSRSIQAVPQGYVDRGSRKVPAFAVAPISAARNGMRVRLPLLNDVDLDLCDTPPNHPELLSGGMRDIDDASANERTAVIDPDRYGATGRDVSDPHPRAEWQGGVSGRQFAGIVFFAARGLRAVPVVAGKPMRRTLGPGGPLAGPERSLPVCYRYTPGGDGCLPAGLGPRLAAGGKGSRSGAAGGD